MCETAAVNKHAFGRGSGAWTICPDELNADSVIYSFGVGTDISFDLELCNAFNATVHAFDPTPVARDWIRSQRLPPGMVFHPFGIADFDGEMAFYPPRRATSSHFAPVQRYRQPVDRAPITGRVQRLTTLMAELGHQQVNLLKIDIEGGEYAVLDDIIDNTSAIDQIAVEFHHSYATVPVSRTIDTVRRLEDAGYRLFHISQRTYEFSFVNERSLEMSC